jgi:hypothetical protein
VISPGFHSQDGLCFERWSDGRVQVRVIVPVLGEYDPRTGDRAISGDAVVFQTTLPASSWASVVAFVSQHGETGETWQQALAFHGE